MERRDSFRLNVKFKGNRTYLHGTDLFDAMVDLNARSSGAALTDIRMSFYRPITQSVEAVRMPPGSMANLHPAALFELQVDHEPAIWALRENVGEPVDGRRPYDEDAVTAQAVVKDRSISQPRPTAYTFIERAVALNKRLLNELRRDAGVSWWFARLELPHLPPPSPGLRLGVETELGGRLVKSSIEVDGQRAGSIYFSEKKA
jgi:hypothetical protein